MTWNFSGDIYIYTGTRCLFYWIQLFGIDARASWVLKSKRELKENGLLIEPVVSTKPSLQVRVQFLQTVLLWFMRINEWSWANVRVFGVTLEVPAAKELLESEECWLLRFWKVDSDIPITTAEWKEGMGMAQVSTQAFIDKSNAVKVGPSHSQCQSPDSPVCTVWHE